jgi:Sec-independent protein translocase protein TatA
MFEVGPEKLFLVLAVAFIVLGPKELPAIARKLGEGMRYLRSVQDTVRMEVNAVLEAPQPVVSGDSPTRHDDTDHLNPRVSDLESDEPGFTGPSSFA